MNAGTVLQALGNSAILEQPELYDNFRAYWDFSQAEFPSGIIPNFQEEVWEESFRYAKLPEELYPKLQRVALAIQQNEALARLAWHTYWRCYRLTDGYGISNAWPEANILGAERGGVNILVALNWVPLLRQYHRRLAIPDDITQNTVRQLGLMAEKMFSFSHDGRMGMFPSQMRWMNRYLSKPYLRIGRLEYCLSPIPDPYYIYRNRQNGQVVALCAAGQSYTAEGYSYADWKEYENEPGIWCSVLHDDGKQVRGNPISPMGRARSQQLTLVYSDWEEVFRPGDWGLRMHIPAGGKMNLTDCGESLQQARDFFQKHFPERDIKLTATSSWIFNPGLEKFLPAESNLNRFQRELYLWPVASGPWDGLWFIYQRDGRPDASFPQQTSLQRQVYEYLQQGHRWRCGGMFILQDDIKHFGQQYYRQNLSMTLASSN